MTLDEYKRRQQQAEQAQQQMNRQNQTVLDQRRDSIKKNIGKLNLKITHMFKISTNFFCHI